MLRKRVPLLMANDRKDWLGRKKCGEWEMGATLPGLSNWGASLSGKQETNMKRWIMVIDLIK